MATNDQLKALVKSHADGDDPQFYAVAMQVAASRTRRAVEVRPGASRPSSTTSVSDLANAPASPPWFRSLSRRVSLGALLNVSYPRPD